MYDSTIMLRNNRKKPTTIVSRLFDTINEISACTSEAEAEAGTSEALAKTETEANYSVSVPNQRNPLKYSSIKPLAICLYQVCTDGLYPFLLFLLHEANFISFVGPSQKKIKYAAVAYMQTILPDANITYAGFSETADKNILVLNCCNTSSSTLPADYHWATSFEIINKRKVIEYSIINKSVLDFFFLHPEFLTLKTLDQQRIYESPMLGYAETQSIEALDIYRERIIPALGKCYYLFTELPPNQADKHIMRIVFFAGKMILPHELENTYDSMLCYHKQCYYYIIQNYNQHVVLSVE
jgi:hypothetical protein